MFGWFKKKSKPPVKRAIMKKELKGYSRNNLITMISGLGQEMLHLRNENKELKKKLLFYKINPLKIKKEQEQTA